MPRQDPHHWQRGISYYYADEFKKGYEQFERHQTVNSNDVENAVWHFLCLARAKGIEEAKKKTDSHRRRWTYPDDGSACIIWRQKHSGESVGLRPKPMVCRAPGWSDSLFYAHLYLGLWYEAKKEMKLRDQYIGLAAAVADNHGYMGDVARVHAVLNKIKVAKPASKK